MLQKMHMFFKIFSSLKAKNVIPLQNFSTFHKSVLRVLQFTILQLTFALKIVIFDASVRNSDFYPKTVTYDEKCEV